MIPADRRSELLAGIRSEIPIAIGGIPFGLIYGVFALAAGLPPALVVGMSSIVFAGSSQFIGAQLMGAGAPGALVVLTTLAVNARHMLYSFSLAPFIGPLSRGWKLLLAYLLTDEAYATAIVHYQDAETPAANKHWFFLGGGAIMWVSWQLSTLAGVMLGAQIPASWSLDFTMALTFIGLVVPLLGDRPARASALAAGVIAVLAFGLPYRMGLLAAALGGILVGVWLERRA